MKPEPIDEMDMGIDSVSSKVSCGDESNNPIELTIFDVMKDIKIEYVKV